MRFLPIILLASVFVNSPVFAGDEETPFFPPPESKADADRVLNAIIKKYNPDLSYKFKQDALNYLLEGVSRGEYEHYILVTKNACFTSYKTAKNPELLHKNCELVKDEKNLTRFRCDEENGLYTFVEYENKCRSGKCISISKSYTFDKPAEYAKEDRISGSTGTYRSLRPHTHEEWLRNLAQDENNPNGYFTKRYKEEFNKDPMQQGE